MPPIRLELPMLVIQNVCVSEKKIHIGKRAAASVVLYKAHKNKRACPSTLLNEATGMSEGLADCEWWRRG